MAEQLQIFVAFLRGQTGSEPVTAHHFLTLSDSISWMIREKDLCRKSMKADLARLRLPSDFSIVSPRNAVRG